jgi:predicted MFS family arabinose efflux permease
VTASGSFRLVSLTLGTFAVGTGSFVIAGILPLVSDSFGVSVTTAGQLVTVFAIAYAVCSPVLAAATGGSGTALAVLLFAFGVGAIVGNFGAGSLTDRLPSRSVINLAVVIGAINYALLPLSSAYFATALIAIAISGVCGYAVVVPQQHRLIAISLASAPLVIALNASAVYIGVALSGPIGAAGIELLGAHQLALLATGLLVLGLLTSEVAHRRSRWPQRRQRESTCRPAVKPSRCIRRIARIRSTNVVELGDGDRLDGK